MPRSTWYFTLQRTLKVIPYKIRANSPNVCMYHNLQKATENNIHWFTKFTDIPGGDYHVTATNSCRTLVEHSRWKHCTGRNEPGRGGEDRNEVGRGRPESGGGWSSCVNSHKRAWAVSGADEGLWSGERQPVWWALCTLGVPAPSGEQTGTAPPWIPQPNTDACPALFQCWDSISDAVPTLKQRLVKFRNRYNPA